MQPSSTHPLLFITALVLGSTATAMPQTTTLESISSERAPGDQGSYRPALSRDGQFVVFHSMATNLVAQPDTNGFSDIYCHDRLTGETERISMGLMDQEPDGHCLQGSTSDDGRYIAFYSFAANLVPGDTNGTWDGFLWDREASVDPIVRFSVGLGGVEANGASGGIGHMDGYRWPSLSDDGRYVAFSSKATNLVAGLTNGVWQIFVKDMLTGTVTLASPGPAGMGGDDDSLMPCLSADGHFVTFQSHATDLGPTDTNGAVDVYVYDLFSGTTELASISDSLEQGNANSSWPVISEDGGIVAFQSGASNLVPGDVNGVWDVFTRNRTSGSTDLLSLSSGRRLGNGDSGVPSISRDGALVAFMSTANNFDPQDTNGVLDIYLHDVAAGSTQRVSLSTTGDQADLKCEVPFLAPDGGALAYQSEASTLDSGDTNSAWDVFVWSPLSCATTVATYCTPSATSIPGCEALMWGQGSPNLHLPDGFEMHAAPVPGSKPGICFWGMDGPASIPFGSMGGRLCVAAPLHRTAPRWSSGTSGTCDGEFVFTLADLHPALPLGVTAHAQVWFRDPANPDGYGLSNAIWFQTCDWDPGSTGG